MLTIQFGQCGNQLGHSLFSTISADIDTEDKTQSAKANYEYAELATEKWFQGITKDGKRLSRAILLDTEQKVIKKICKKTNPNWTYCSQNLICQGSGGSANNWAYGHFIKGPNLKQETLEIVRREFERADRLEGILFLFSSAGGTGSGVGSYFLELLRQEFPTKTLIGLTVLPFSSGEVGTQNYNTLLALAKFSELCDTNFLFENQQIHSICTSLLKNSEATLSDVNDIISKKLAAVFQPVDIFVNSNELVSLIAPHPCFRFASIKSVPYYSSDCSAYESSYKWHSHIHHLKQTLRIKTLDNELIDAETKKISHTSIERSSQKYCKSLSNILITRGTSLSNDPIVCDSLKEKSLYLDWIPDDDRFRHLNQRRRLLNQEKFVSLVTNNSQIYRSLDFIVVKAWEMYTHSAFLHQYKKFGLEEDDFLHAFAKVENVIKSYKDIIEN